MIVTVNPKLSAATGHARFDQKALNCRRMAFASTAEEENLASCATRTGWRKGDRNMMEHIAGEQCWEVGGSECGGYVRKKQNRQLLQEE